MRVGYRLGQFWRLLRARPLPAAHYADVAAALSPAQLALFAQYRAGDQWHCYAVYRSLRAAGHRDPDLLVAALLHDVGKNRLPLTLWQRSLIVLAGRLWPARAAAWGIPATGAGGWRRAFLVKAQHAAWGAEMAAAAGSSSRVVALIRRHQDPPPPAAAGGEDALLRLLQWADERH